MFLSRESHNRARSAVIKLNGHPSKLKIVDYKSILEEIETDKKQDVKVRLHDLTGNAAADNSAAIPGQVGSNYNGSPSKSEAVVAFEDGFEAGKTEAAKVLQVEYEKRVQAVIENFASITRQFAAEVERYNQEFDNAVVTLAIAVAKRVVAREIEVDDGAVLARSREAIRKIIGVEKIKIHVNPSDEEYIREHRNELSGYADSVKEIVVESDNKVERGGCVIESDLGNIDARISTQFELIEEALLGLIK